MNIVLLIIKLIPTILSLVGLAEKLFSDKPQSGAEKKNFVMEVLKALLSGGSAVFTGGAKDTFERIKDPVSVIVDNAAGIAFPNTKTTAMGGPGA